MRAILVVLHCRANTGYAISPLESTFFKMAERLVPDWSKIHFAYPDLSAGLPTALPSGFQQIIQFDAASSNAIHGAMIRNYIRTHSIDVAFGFDLPPHRPMYKYMREGGVKRLFAYWGAPMSSINSGLRLLLKRLDVARRRHGPDHYIFESYGMRDTGVFGRGIPIRKTSVVRLGVDVSKFSPDSECAHYIYDEFGIPSDRKIFFYAGHMEERKGVHVLVKALRSVVESHGRSDAHLVILGNRDGEAERFDPLIGTGPARDHITFGGYRSDIPQLLQGAYVGVIASTGWDSFPRTAVEMSAAQVPLLVSDLAGLREVVQPGITGERFPVGDDAVLAQRMATLLDHPELVAQMGRAARAHALSAYDIDHQIDALADVVRTHAEN